MESLIRQNPYDSAWWGQSVGAITAGSFFERDVASSRDALKPFAWVEFKAPLDEAPPFAVLQQLGFVLADVQMPFRLALKTVPDALCLSELECCSAALAGFEVDPSLIRDFEHERFLQLRGIAQAKLCERYAHWANQLVREHPEWSFCLRRAGKVQGWFLSEPAPRGLSLTLAMLSKSATVSGAVLFHKALRAYAAMGAGIGFASFSVRNTPVLNIYSTLGAKFLPVIGNWLWQAERT